jgi:hypothetical protein
MAVLTGGHVGPYGVADLAKTLEVVGGHRLLQPADVEVGRGFHDADGLLARVTAVGVDVEVDVVADDRARLAHPGQVPGGLGAPGFGDLDLDAGNALFERPVFELLVQPPLVVGGESAAAVHRYLVVDGAEQPVQR